MGRRTKLVPAEAVPESQILFERCLNGETIRDVEVQRKRKDGSIVDIRLAATPMYNPDGKAWGVAWAYDDITGRKKAERQLKQIAHYDQLTGLPNRVSLKNELTNLLTADGRHRPHSIAMFDLDGFKDVNDNGGHSTGDQLLMEVARRLRSVACEAARADRLGGARFVGGIPDWGRPRGGTGLVESRVRKPPGPC